jgi:prepilin peptidase CpaA
MVFMNAMAIAPVAVISLLWVATATDLSDRRIPNWISLWIVILFLIYCGLGYGDISLLHHLGWASVTFIGLFIFFAFGKIGGGDVKLMSAVMLWAGPEQGIRFLYITAIIGGLIALILIVPLSQQVWLWIRAKTGLSCKPYSRGCPVSVPYGLAISVAGTVCLYDGFLHMDHS